MLIKPLQWRDYTLHSVSETPFGQYKVSNRGDKFIWSYYFGGYDEGHFNCDSLEQGKTAAMRHWTERLTPCLNR